MLPPVQAGKNAGPAGGTNRCSGEGVGEAGALGSQGVYIGRVNNRVASAAQRVPALVVRLHKEDIWMFADHLILP